VGALKVLRGRSLQGDCMSDVSGFRADIHGISQLEKGAFPSNENSKSPLSLLLIPQMFFHCSPHFCTLAADYITAAATLFMDHM